ncbi:MAG: iron-sulfur cluster assembly accessory protein [Cyanobacteria bacterium J06634_6]
MIRLTPAARQEIDRLRQRQNQSEAICRLGLQPSSCAQWAYTLSLTASTEGDDDVYEFQGLQVAVNREHASYVQGLEIDFAEDLTGGAFRFDNPLATESCRCGYAFAIR